MSNLLWWRGDATQTTSRLVVRSDTNGLIILSGIGDDQSQTADTTVNDGIVVFDIENLSANGEYTGVITHADLTTETVTVGTLPDTWPIRIGWWSCIDQNKDFYAGGVLLRRNPHMVYNLGDASYGVATSTPWGFAISAATNNGQPGGYDVADANLHLRIMHMMPTMQKVMHGSAYYYTPDDHDCLAGNDWDHTTAGATIGDEPLTTPTAAEVYTHWQTARTAHMAYMSGNPDNSNTGEIPSGSTDTDASFYKPNYFSKRINNVEIFNLDVICSRSTLAATDNSSKYMIGPLQEAALIAGVTGSTADFKIIMSGKKLHRLATDNSDTWGQYTTQRDRILTAISGVTGVLWCTGDTHQSTAAWNTQAEIDAGGKPYIDITACPATKFFFSNLSAGYGSEGLKWKLTGETGTLNPASGTYENAMAHCVGYIEVYQNYLEVSVVSVTGHVWFTGRLNAGEQYLEDKTAKQSFLSSSL